jgi:hypothetical protein
VTESKQAREREINRERKRDRERRCEDEKMWRREKQREDVWRWQDPKVWRWEDVKMRGCEDVKMWRWEDVAVGLWFTLRRSSSMSSYTLGKTISMWNMLKQPRNIWSSTLSLWNYIRFLKTCCAKGWWPKSLLIICQRRDPLTQWAIKTSGKSPWSSNAPMRCCQRMPGFASCPPFQTRGWIGRDWVPIGWWVNDPFSHSFLLVDYPFSILGLHDMIWRLISRFPSFSLRVTGTFSHHQNLKTLRPALVWVKSCLIRQLYIYII